MIRLSEQELKRQQTQSKRVDNVVKATQDAQLRGKYALQEIEVLIDHDCLQRVCVYPV